MIIIRIDVYYLTGVFGKLFFLILYQRIISSIKLQVDGRKGCKNNHHLVEVENFGYASINS